MVKEQVFNAIMSSMSMYGGLFKEIADDIGLEKALDYHAKQGESFGAMISGTLKRQLGDKAPTTEALKTVLQPEVEGWGFDAEFDVSPTEVSIEVQRCPCYEGFKMAGLDHETIDKMCSAWYSALYAQLKKYYPKIEGSLKYRDSSEGYCLDKFTLK